MGLTAKDPSVLWSGRRALAGGEGSPAPRLRLGFRRPRNWSECGGRHLASPCESARKTSSSPSSGSPIRGPQLDAMGTSSSPSSSGGGKHHNPALSSLRRTISRIFFGTFSCMGRTCPKVCLDMFRSADQVIGRLLIPYAIEADLDLVPFPGKCFSRMARSVPAIRGLIGNFILCYLNLLGSPLWYHGDLVTR